MLRGATWRHHRKGTPQSPSWSSPSESDASASEPVMFEMLEQAYPDPSLQGRAGNIPPTPPEGVENGLRSGLQGAQSMVTPPICQWSRPYGSPNDVFSEKRREICFGVQTDLDRAKSHEKTETRFLCSHWVAPNSPGLSCPYTGGTHPSQFPKRNWRRSARSAIRPITV
jgi:hypothetical protein